MCDIKRLPAKIIIGLDNSFHKTISAITDDLELPMIDIDAFMETMIDYINLKGEKDSVNADYQIRKFLAEELIRCGEDSSIEVNKIYNAANAAKEIIVSTLLSAGAFIGDTLFYEFDSFLGSNAIVLRTSEISINRS
jgi:hypothetical protein